MRLAPFFEMGHVGWSKVLNRILIVSELAFMGGLLYMQHTEPFAGDWFYAVIVLGWYLGVSLLNFAIHKVNEIVIALWYGTTDPDEICSIVSRRSDLEKARDRIIDLERGLDE